MNELNRQLISMYAKQLRVPTFNQYEEVIRQLDGDKGFDDFLVSLMRAELENRQDGNRKRKIRSARFPYTKTLEEFDFSYLEHVSEAQIRQLASCDYISQKQNVVMIGNPGTGKTHLSIALGLKACMQGLNVRFYTAANLSNELIEALDGHRLLKLEKQIASCDLLIIDEMSYLTFNRHQSELLFKVIADRSERKSIIVSTNLPFSEWLTMFENQTMVAAILKSVRNPEKAKRELDATLESLHSGDIAGLAEMCGEIARETPQIYRKLFVERNIAIAEKLLPLLKTGKVCFVLVGAGHFAGQDNIRELLVKAGCQVVQLDKTGRKGTIKGAPPAKQPVPALSVP